jgi:site-specific recombinase XerD
VKWHGIAAGVREASPHALRHACATHLLRGGADLRHVQQLLGHKQIHTTHLYTTVDLSDLKKTLKKSHPRERAFQKAHEWRAKTVPL